jgi:hypothetical protein
MTTKYYVYELIDPRTNKPFYIGKGKNDRIHHHEKNASKDPSTPKNKLILEIKVEGLEIVKNIIKEFKSEDAAFRYEKKLITQIGLNNLTNIAPGGKWTSPYFFKKDDQKEYDKCLISMFALFVRKTGKNGEYGFTVAGKHFPLDPRLFPKMKEKIAGIIEVRGFNWVSKEFKKHNINFELASKVENHG